ncbi:hypothetical protein HPB51_025970 [Rhipicephalus microplus]|uniref:ascorbate ferrireductase (transmembrane) n=1 Tax=Rhipicephalus microplus TaxID=6941 RepID=A0A9J6EEI7_RHIMP|nr:hypothetical protein HPB51_025970 [Rhipicephalus microplus]
MLWRRAGLCNACGTETGHLRRHCQGVVGDLGIETPSASGHTQLLRALQRVMRLETMDAGEAKYAATGAGDAASSLDERRPVLAEKYDTASEPEEKEVATADTSQENSTEDTQSQLADMSTQAAARRDMPEHGMTRGINASSAIKRRLEKSASTAHESKVEGPPAKATPARRSGLRARSNLPVDRLALLVTSSKLMPDHWMVPETKSTDAQFGLVTHPAVLLVRLGRTRLHWALQAAAIACALLACVAAFVHKAGLNKAHFTTWHAWTGLAALLLSLVEGIVGVAALTLRASTVGKQYPWLKYRMLRRVHRAMGLSAHGFATAAMVLGLRSNYGRQALAQALGTESLVLQLVVQALAAAPFASVVQHLYRGR